LDNYKRVIGTYITI